jgi:hypothetical protein
VLVPTIDVCGEIAVYSKRSPRLLSTLEGVLSACRFSCSRPSSKCSASLSSSSPASSTALILQALARTLSHTRKYRQDLLLCSYGILSVHCLSLGVNAHLRQLHFPSLRLCLTFTLTPGMHSHSPKFSIACVLKFEFVSLLCFVYQELSASTFSCKREVQDRRLLQARQRQGEYSTLSVLFYSVLTRADSVVSH